MEAVLARKGEISLAAGALARLDVSAALAERAAEGGWCRPHFEETQCLAIEGGHHHVVEAALAKDDASFIANDCLMESNSRRWLVKGANMGGNSTFQIGKALCRVRVLRHVSNSFWA